MAIALHLSAADMDPDTLDSITRDLNEALGDVAGARSELAARPLEAGERGAAVVIGTILLDVLKSSAAGSLIEVLGAWFNRERSIEGTITAPDGRVITINAKNLDSAEFQSALAAMLARPDAE